MQVYFDLLLTERTLNETTLLREKFKEWGGQYYSYEPRTYTWNERLIFESQEVPSYIWSYLPNELQELDWVNLSLKSNDIQVWENSINVKKETELLLKSFLIEIGIQLKQCVVILEPNGDEIANIHNLSMSKVIEKIELLLNWKTQDKGFITWQNTDD